MFALSRSGLGNYWPIKDVSNGLLYATFILRCVVHFECTEVEIWFGTTHICFNVSGIWFTLFGSQEVRILFLLRLNVAVLESGSRNVITLLRKVRLAELGDERHTLRPGFWIVPNAVVWEIVFSRWLSLPGISIAHVNITLSSLSMIDLLKCTDIPFLLCHNFFKRTIWVNRFWSSTFTLIT